MALGLCCEMKDFNSTLTWLLLCRLKITPELSLLGFNLPASTGKTSPPRTRSWWRGHGRGLGAWLHSPKCETWYWPQRQGQMVCTIDTPQSAPRHEFFIQKTMTFLYKKILNIFRELVSRHITSPMHETLNSNLHFSWIGDPCDDKII